MIHVGGFAGCLSEALHPDQSLPGQFRQAEIHHAQADAQAPGHPPLGDVGILLHQPQHPQVDIILVNGNVHKPNFIIYLMLKRNGFFVLGSDRNKCLLLRKNQFKNRGFLLLEGAFWGQKVPSKGWGGIGFLLIRNVHGLLLFFV
jgi:hypothetical protein